MPLLLLPLFAAPAGAAEPGLGETLLQKCQICHTLNAGGRVKVGPNLYGIYGRRAGTAPGYNASDVIKNSGIVWDDETLTKFLREPRTLLPGNRMTFPGITDEAALADLLARLKQATQ
jgi:cytochrome c